MVRFELRFLPWRAMRFTLFVAAPGFAPFEPGELTLDQPTGDEIDVVLRRAEPGKDP